MTNYINIDTPGRPLVDLIDFSIAEADINVEMANTTIKEIVCHESLLTPGLQTFVTIQSAIYLPVGKNWDKVKGSIVRFVLSRAETGSELVLAATNGKHVVYRMDNRVFKPDNTSGVEEFTLHCCDESLLLDSASLVSKSWKCTSPGDVVKYVLQNCANVDENRIDIKPDNPQPNRDYIAENIHPFQVVSQQANVALDEDEPSYLHYMTYQKSRGSEDIVGQGIHNFKSLKHLRNQPPVWTFRYGDTGYGDTVSGEFTDQPGLSTIISMEFPCDFDLLAEVMNGISNNQNKNTLGVFNPMQKSFSQLGNSTKGCGIGGFNYKEAVTNKGTAKAQDSCNLDVENHLLKRQAIMNLIDKDKIALRMVVPWNPVCQAGSVVRLMWNNKYAPEVPVFGDGDYLILSVAHTYRAGGFSTTTMDCVTQTVGG